MQSANQESSATARVSIIDEVQQSRSLRYKARSLFNQQYSLAITAESHTDNSRLCLGERITIEFIEVSSPQLATVMMLMFAVSNSNGVIVVKK